MRRLRALLTDERGCFPSRRTWESGWRPSRPRCPRRSPAWAHLVALVDPWGRWGRAAAIDSPILRARGGVWHKKGPSSRGRTHTSIDTAAHWTKSGWHGCVYGWKLHLATAVAAVWIPLAAELTPANRADNEEAPALLRRRPAEVRFVRGHVQYATLHEGCAADDQVLLTSKRGPYPHSDDGIEVRRSSTNCAPGRWKTSTANSMRSSVAWTKVPTRG